MPILGLGLIIIFLTLKIHKKFVRGNNYLLSMLKVYGTLNKNPIRLVIQIME